MSATKKEQNFIQEEQVSSTADVPKSVMSKEEAHIADLVKEQPKDASQFNLKTLSRFNLLELPEECKPFHKKKFRYKWLSKQNLEVKLNSTPWILCTRSNSPYIKDHRFKDHGAVGKELSERPAKRSAALVKHYTEDLPKDEMRGFYSPESSGEEDDSEGLIEGKDF